MLSCSHEKEDVFVDSRFVKCWLIVSFFTKCYIMVSSLSWLPLACSASRHGVKMEKSRGLLFSRCLFLDTTVSLADDRCTG